jgi:hypothetical protein
MGSRAQGRGKRATELSVTTQRVQRMRFDITSLLDTGARQAPLWHRNAGAKGRNRGTHKEKPGPQSRMLEISRP